uniref:methylenetetrahydrofolate reductase [NAD(P)H] n=1 Tax=Altererythrobacter segetis TaxID=1104773 RepID=UPI001FAEFEF1|nr:methylenetetrahydrofolate reductase [NAD(P)H] [Altererythrobacter segetis]
MRRWRLNGSAFADPAEDISVSFEFYPPRSAIGESQLWEAVDKLLPCGPSFVSVTYGACGAARDGTLAAVRRLTAETPLPVAAHLTCAGISKAEAAAAAENFWSAGARHIVALRGDGGPAGTRFAPHPQGYCNAAELVQGLLTVAPFEISVAAYPETHPDAASAEADLDNLKRKLDAGATRALTQFFFNPETFLRFRDRAAAAGIRAPIVPGILPVTNFAQTRKFAEACGAEVPAWMAQLFLGLDRHPEPRNLVAATVAAELCRSLHAEAVREFHFFTLNRAELTQAICHILGRRLPAQLEHAA